MPKGRVALASVLTLAALLAGAAPAMAVEGTQERGGATSAAASQPGHYQLRILSQEDGVTRFAIQFSGDERLELGEGGTLLVKTFDGRLIEEIGSAIRTPQGSVVAGRFTLDGVGGFSFREIGRETPTRVKRGWPG